MNSGLRIALISLACLAADFVYAERATFSTRHTDRKMTMRYSYGFTTSFFKILPSYDNRLRAQEAGIEDTLDQSISSEPNIQATHSFGVSYKWFAFSYKYPIPKSEGSIASKGKTESVDYRLNFHTSYFSVSATHQSYKSLFQTLPKDTSVVDGVDSYPIFPDMKLDKTGADIIFKLSPKSFSLEAIQDQSTIQTQSGGSLLARLSANEVRVSNGGAPILRSKYHEQYPEDGAFTRFRSFLSAVDIGYGYTFVFAKRFFLGGVMTLGRTFARGEYEVSGTTKKFTSDQWNYNYAMLSLGINTKDFFMGASYLIDAGTATTNEFYVLTPMNYGEVLYLGYRF